MSSPLVSYKEVADITSKDLILKGCLMYGNRVGIPGQLKNKMSIIHADHVGITRCKLMQDHISCGLELLDTRKATFLIVVDDYTKWIECFILNNTNLGNIIASLSECFSRFSVPSVIVSDNGSPFNCNVFFAYC
ncbi:hypothetical protein PR048_019859 [Dryococelus australis]|uniref:Integrase catalytic domain-containing protein n=1 Tax=Dryococelus australis TaxID=614101 RepID=A0ABQ9H4P5_9NEOP|nr:hypothetical protein PR048_019859 [Dryococelus australis]